MSIRSTLGTMTQIANLRTVWQNEATDFTPWLAENMGLLNDATGLSLEVVEQESPVGSFSLDILAQDTDTGAYAVIENQLEDTNHDHLGKLLTYAAGKDAKHIIWIVKSAREEHRAAIEWLNGNTVDGVGFFLLEIQLWSIDGSLPAPRFNVVEQPNDWVKIIKRPSGGVGGTAAQFKYEYWTAFNDYAFKDAAFAAQFHRRKASSDHWYDLSIGSSEAHIALLVNTKADLITMEFSIPNSKELYDKLEEHRNDIESTIGEKLDWRRLDNKKASRILLEHQTDLKDTAERQNQFEWFMKYATAFKRAFTKFL